MAAARVPFHAARLAAHEDAGGGLTRVILEVAPEVAVTYASPGQYVDVRVEGQTGFFVLASEPGHRSWELVMRAGGGASDVLLTAPDGASIEVTPALGEGFPMAEVARAPLVVALSGTGIAAGLPIVRYRVRDTDALRTHVFIGIRTRAELALRSEVEAWISNGVDVTVCLSNDDERIAGIQCAAGHVQDVLAARARAGTLSPGRIFAVGVASMIDALRARASDLGIAPEDVLTNH